MAWNNYSVACDMWVLIYSQEKEQVFDIIYWHALAEIHVPSQKDCMGWYVIS